MFKISMNKTVSTPAGKYSIERKPGNWQKTAGALEDSREEIKAALQMLKEEAHAE